MTEAATAPDILARRIADEIEALPESTERHLVAIAGPPGVGKSTVTALVHSELTARGIEAGILPMDGFHFDNAVLNKVGLRDRKGAPETFDVAGFAAILERLLTEDEVAVPEFDRDRDVAIAARSIIGPDERVVIVEGNYLLLNEAPWANCARFWAFCVFLDAPIEALEDRLIKRWTDQGMDLDAARERALGNDIPNANRTLSNSSRGDILLR